MYRIFKQNLNNFFEINKHGDPDSEFRLKIARVLRGMADKALYGKWKIENNESYEEVNNLVWEIRQNTDHFRRFDIFFRDLWGHGYKAEKSETFPKEIVEEQLKLINLLLGTQYWVDIAKDG